MMASGLTATSAEAARSAKQVATSIILGEVTTFVAAQPVPASLLAPLNRAIKQGSLTREGALLRILQMPKVRAGLAQDLAENLLNRDLTPAESRALVAGMQTRGADIPGALLQVMAKPEYFKDQGATNTGFVQATTTELLHRPASSHELAKDVRGLDRGGAPARAGFLGSLIATRQFRLALTQDAFQQFAGTSGTPTQQAAALKAFQGPLGYTKMLAQVLASGASSTGIVPTMGANSGLSVKRVPGFLTGWTVPNLASPYDVANISDRTIDSKTVDYWAITLSALDALSLTIVPTDNPANTGFALRIWGPDGTEVGAAETGAQFTFVAKTAGTYTLGISTKDDTGYTFLPQGQQQAPSGPTLRTFTAEFQSIPGPNTNAINILLNYKNPAYTDGNWPTWTAAQAQAYKTLTMIASAGASEPNPGPLTNFTDFRQVGDITDPATISGWLEAAWKPFSVIMNDPDNSQIASISYQYVFKAYSLPDWTNIVTAFINNADFHNAYTSLDSLLENANDARSHIYNDFLLSLESWNTASQVQVASDPTLIAGLLTTNLTVAPTLPQPVERGSWFKTLINSIVNLSAAAFTTIVGTYVPGTGPIASLAGAEAANLVTNCVDDWLDGAFGNPKPPPPPEPTKLGIFDVAAYMQTVAADAYIDTFQLMTSSGFLSKLFSNYGLLEAMGTVRFTSDVGGQITPANVLRQNYDRSIWEQLLPQVYSWKLVEPADDKTDDEQDDTLPNFTFIIPESENVTFDLSSDVAPIKKVDPKVKAYTQEHLTFTLSGEHSHAQAVADALTEVEALQSGTKDIPFPGYDFTPSDGNYNDDWFGPGPVSIPRPIEGRSGRFYTVSTNSTMTGTLYRQWKDPNYFFGPLPFYSTINKLEGVTIHQWALETPDGSGGFLELPQAAADALFGTGDLTLASPDPVAYKGGGSYFDFNVPDNGVATRFDVFTQWGKDVPGYAPTSLQPPDVVDHGNMEVGYDPKNYYTPNMRHSYVTTYSIAYGANTVQGTRKRS